MLTQLMSDLRHWRGSRALDACGAGTRVPGGVEKRGTQSRIEVGRGCLISGRLITETPNSLVRIGDNSLVGADSIVAAAQEIIVEEDVLISYRCIITDSDNHSLRYSERKHDLEAWMQGRHDWSRVKSAPVRICRGAWIGAQVIVTKGVTIGEGAVCGMGSVVTRDVAPYTVVAGNPARVVRELAETER
ncbi:MAG: acyltransferase [Deltaproteobacteria bacterium]|nr:acyltransferase [Deltaproteobacteria bacterium]